MKQTSKRLSSSLLALLFLVAAFVLFFELIEPAYGNLQTLKGQELSDQQFLSSEQQLVTSAKSLLTEYQSESQAQQNLALAMPSGPDISGALAQVYGIATANGINVSSIGISTPVVQLPPPATPDSTPLTASQIVEPIGTISFEVSATGSYEDLSALLKGLETNIRIFDVTDLSIQANPQQAVTGSKTPANPDFFTYSFSVSTYYQLQQAQQ